MAKSPNPAAQAGADTDDAAKKDGRAKRKQLSELRMRTKDASERLKKVSAERADLRTRTEKLKAELGIADKGGKTSRKGGHES